MSMGESLNLKTLSEDPLVEIDVDSKDIWVEDRKVFDGKLKEIVS